MKISIHALLAESDDRGASNQTTQQISIHALLAESDQGNKLQDGGNSQFLSTLSLRRATARRASRQQPAGISIHALLAESDRWMAGCKAGPTKHFYPRSPCGERRLSVSADPGRFAISIHALLAESDIGTQQRLKKLTLFLSTLSLRRATSATIARPYVIGDFYPRSPCGERPGADWLPRISLIISIHALLAESDWMRTAT